MSLGHGTGGVTRAKLGLTTRGPTRVVTDPCVIEPDPVSSELAVTVLHPGVTRVLVEQGCGWPVRFVDDLTETPPPTADEVSVLRDMHERPRRGHAATAAKAA